MRPDLAELRRRVSFDPETGVLWWKADPPRGRSVGEALPTRDNGNGYLYASFNRRGYAVHRLIWAIEHNEWPGEIDHVNCVKADNRLRNLRSVTHAENSRNIPRIASNTSGYKGVGWHKCRERWRAYIQIDGRQKSLGYHDTPEEAHAAYWREAQKRFGEFARAG